MGLSQKPFTIRTIFERSFDINLYLFEFFYAMFIHLLQNFKL